jgi:hypothetical protein
MTPNRLADMLSPALLQSRFVCGVIQHQLPTRMIKITMLDYARQRAIEALGSSRIAVLVTSGPAGVQAGEFPCETLDLALFILVPQTSDHLFNLEHESTVTVLAAGCELKGQAHIISSGASDLKLDLWQEPGAEWCVLVRVDPSQVQIRNERGWGSLETIDL